MIVWYAGWNETKCPINIIILLMMAT